MLIVDRYMFIGYTCFLCLVDADLFCIDEGDEEED